jgi:hypothetical protein
VTAVYIITVDEISSISESYFGFKKNGGIIKEFPMELLCKEKEISYGKKDTYHLNEKLLFKLSDSCIDIFPFSACVGYKEYGHLSKNQYIELMKYTLYWYIENGQMTGFIARLLLTLGYDNSDLQIVWDKGSNKTPRRPPFCKLPL